MPHKKLQHEILRNKTNKNHETGDVESYNNNDK